MAGGNRKKKKPAVNPARGFATTSTQSKSKVDSVQDAESTNESASLTPDVASTPASKQEQTGNATSNANRELHELSPEELEAQLESSELQQFVDKHAAKVRKDASRQVSRMQTDKRLLRGQADFLSLKDWLPEELMQLIFDFTLTDTTGDGVAKGQKQQHGDDLVAKVWSLRLVLLDLDIPAERVNEVVAHLLNNHPEDSSSQLWGLAEALDWLALHTQPEELLEYDSQKRKLELDEEDDLPDANDQEQSTHDKHDSQQSGPGNDAKEEPMDDDVEVSDIESDLEPDELISHYVRTKARLYEINPDIEDTKPKKKGGAKTNGQSQQKAASSPAQRKLQQKLEKIERDVLFDEREAQAQWSTQKIDLIQRASERRKLQLSEETTSNVSTNSNKPSGPRSRRSSDGLNNAEDDVDHLDGDSQGDDLLSGIFDSLPGVSTQTTTAESGQDGAQSVTIRDFGRISGMTPRRVLEETCRARDSRSKLTYKQVSPTTYSCRHSVSIEWTKDQGIYECPYLPSVSVKSRNRLLIVTMMGEATPETAQSEAYVATAALFVVFSDSPKEEKAHLRLPPAFRNLWDEFAQLKREHTNAADRATVKELRRVVEQHAQDDDDDDDEVVFNASHRRLNGAASGTSTPASRPQTPRIGGPDTDQALKDLWARKSAASSYQRMLSARANLPMFHSKDVALETIARNQVSIVVGDTGSGKSTQVPQFILEHELAHGRQCKIYCTEPRRISAISLAQRVSEELGEHKGDLGTARSLVGYAIRLESQTVSQTKLVYATVGIVLRMLENEDGLGEITHLVLDEVHERSIDTDFLLIVLLSLLQKRPDLKVVLMSATVDAQKFSNYLNGAPIITVPGRTFPVQAKFLEDAIELTGHTVDDNGAGSEVQDDDMPESDRENTQSKSQQLDGYSKKTKSTLAKYDEYRIDHSLIVKLLETLASHSDYQVFSRAILIFMPGIAEIRQLNDILLGHPAFSKGWRIHALHSTFSSEDQQAAFEVPPEGTRKIVIATNIAETGITIPDVTCVVDTGKHREMRFDERRQMSRLTQSFIARANAKQRRGRAGRVQEGICFHLFTKYRFDELMIEQQTPEMLRLSLQDLVMRVRICKLGNTEDALGQALDPPLSKNVRRAIDALVEVGALNESEQLTPLGSQLAKLPLDAQLGKLILFGASFGCLDSALTIAATLTSKSPFLSPLHAKKQADSVRLGFKKGDSDLLTLYNAYCAWRKICSTQGVSEYHFCNKNFLSPQNLANIEDLKGQLLTALADAGFVNLGPTERSALMRVKPGSRQRNFVTLPEKYCKADESDVVASSVIAWSFYPKIVKQEGKGWRNIANNQSLALHPTSVNKVTLSPDVKYLSFYSIMQSSSKYTNAQETTPVSDFALTLLTGEATFHMYAGVIVVDGNRLKFKLRDWKTMYALKMLRTKVKEALGRLFKHPGRELGDRQRRWMELIERIFEQRQK